MARVPVKGEPLSFQRAEKDELAVRQYVEQVRRADSAKGVAKSAKDLLAHVQSVQDGRRRRVEEQLMALKRERDLAQRRVKELEEALQVAQLHPATPRGLEQAQREETSFEVLQHKLLQAEEGRRVALKDVSKLKDEIDDLKVLISLQKHMSQERTIKAKYQTKLDRMKGEISQCEREITGLAQELEGCIQERNRAIKERNDALAQLSQVADENDRLKSYISYHSLERSS